MPNPIGPRSNPINAIGTPLSPSATRVMLLGAGELGKEVIIALQRLGVEVIAVDRYENAPGHQVAHRAHVIAMTDGDALRRLVEQEKPHLIVPYTLDANDMRFATAQGFNTAEQFYTYLKDSFDVLYEEGESAPKMMSIGMHCRLLGRPGRFRALQRFLDYVQQHERVWVCTRQQIAGHWREVHPFRG